MMGHKAIFNIAHSLYGQNTYRPIFDYTITVIEHISYDYLELSSEWNNEQIS